MPKHQINDVALETDTEVSPEETFKFIHGDEQGIYHAISEQLKISVLPDDDHVRVYRRVLKRLNIQANDSKGLSITSPVGNDISYIVAELGDVRLYFKDGSIILTKQKLV